MQNLAENSENRRLASVEALTAFREGLAQQKDPNQPEVVICYGTGCLAAGAAKVETAIRDALKEQGQEENIKVRPLIKTTGCRGFCSRGPLVVVQPEGYFYQRVKPEDAAEIISNTIAGGEAIERLLYTDPASGEAIAKEKDIPFYSLQERRVLGRIGAVDPTDIDEAIAAGAYQGFARALAQLTPEGVVAEMEKSGLRGRGGAGFPTGRKWKSALSAIAKKGRPVYVVCNGDEGDPGAFMDCMIMEGDPHAVLEGMLIAAYALGAEQGYIYVRAEYPVAIKHLNLAMAQARELGILGENILGTGMNFDIRINRGAGAFVCGESTALFTSIEGRAGEPRPKYVRSVEEGLWGRPTVLNNVETYANVGLVLKDGGEEYAKVGVPHSTGTKVFSLVGKVNNVGLVEVPMGVPLSHIVENIGGGVPGGAPFKAVQTGGPSGGCVPYSLKDTPVDYDNLTKVGSMMGSGGMIVMDDKDCVVDVARYFLSFLEEESCGKCTPCRLGLTRMRDMMDAFSKGQGSRADLEDLKSLGQAIADGSLCALGGSAPNPVLTTLRYFEDEYLAHIEEHRCPAGICKSLITYSIDPEACTGCGVCRRACPVAAISGEKKKAHQIDSEICIRCGICGESCKFGAVSVA